MELLKAKGLKSTQARRDILALFNERHTLLRAEDIFAKVKKKGTDLATVYRTLETFEEQGIIRKVDVRSGSDVYELAGHHHHHIVCTKCNIVEGFNDCNAEDISSMLLKNSKNFNVIQDHSFEFFGVCKSCAKR